MNSKKYAIYKKLDELQKQLTSIVDNIDENDELYEMKLTTIINTLDYISEITTKTLSSIANIQSEDELIDLEKQMIAEGKYLLTKSSDMLDI